jgi:chromosomal replication initiator protein
MEEKIRDMWQDILQDVKKEYSITDVSFRTWLEPLTIYKVENDTIYILLKNESDQFGINYIKKRYETPIKVTIAEKTGKEFQIKLIQQKDITEEEVSYDPELMNSHLNPKYTFDTFVVGNNNRFAQNAALAVAETPGEVYNPLYIYGGPGLGKTHLMHAIGNFILREDQTKKVLYVTSEEFVNEMIESLRSSNNTNAMSTFRNKYRAVDVLMIDDIQFIIGKESTQEEFFHTFNTLHAAGKQIILTSDRPPKEMKTLEERIRSRFEWGLMADIGYPDYETRMAIIRNKVETEHINLSDDILQYIGENIKSNIREIEGALNKLSALSRLEQKEITMDVAVNELQNIISPEKPKEITPQSIIEVVAEHYQISIDQMVSKNRSNVIAKPRQIAMYLCKKMTDSPLEAIGKLLGGRDHSTIIHGANKISEEEEKNPELKSQIETIEKKINPN